MQDKDPWPERVIYVCSASRGITPNRAPLRHAGSVRGRVKGVLILKGIADRKHPTLTEEQDVIGTAKVLWEIATGEVGLEPDDVQFFQENPHRLDAWTGAMEKAAQMAGDDATIAFNITGGTKQMTLGTLLGHRAGMPKLILVSKPNVGPVQLIHHDGQRLDTVTLPFAADDTLKDFLACHRRFEIDPDARKRTELWRLDQMRAVEFLVGRRMGERAQIIDSINQGIPNEQKWNQPWHPFRFAPARKKGLVPDATFEFAGMVDGLRTQGGEIIVESRDADRFLRCGWLETLCFRKVRDALADTDAEVIMGLELTPLRNRQRNAPAAEREIDVAVFWKDVLLSIECKSGFALHKPEDVLCNLDDARVTFSGRSAATFVALPIINPDMNFVPDTRARAADRAVIPLIGWKEFNRVGHRVREYFDSL